MSGTQEQKTAPEVTEVTVAAEEAAVTELKETEIDEVSGGKKCNSSHKKMVDAIRRGRGW